MNSLEGLLDFFGGWYFFDLVTKLVWFVVQVVLVVEVVDDVFVDFLDVSGNVLQM